MAIGLDFGTTNSSAAVAKAGEVRLLDLSPELPTQNERAVLRSLIYFDAERKDERRRPFAFIGNDAIRAALDPYLDGRLIQSVKSYLASQEFRGTRVFGAKYTLPDLIAILLRAIRQRAEESGFGAEGPVFVGRPARYVGADTDKLALSRMSEALTEAGFTDFQFVLEPLAAAYAYERRLNRDEIVLIGDFGGGTSDFCLMRVGPSRRAAAAEGAVLAIDGLGLAGDALDARIVEHVIAPALGRGREFRAPSGKSLPVPMWLYEHLRQWHRLSFMDTPETRAVIAEIIQGSDDKAAFEGLSSVIADRLGYRLARAVELVKIALSSAETARLVFAAGPIRIDEEIARADFEHWIAPELSAIEHCIDRVIGAAGLRVAEVDAVFLTGGTAFIPAVRRLFSRRFGEDKLKGGGELVSVATGLALSEPRRP